MLREDIKGLLKATPRDLRKFGLTVRDVSKPKAKHEHEQQF